MNENSPICDSATAIDSATLNGYPRRRTMTSAMSGLPIITTANVARIRPGASTRYRGDSNMPTATKNSTANASRIGSASDAARRL